LAKVSGFVAGMRTAGKAVGDFNRKLLDGAGKHKGDLDQLSNSAGLFGVAMLGAAALAVKSFAEFDASMSRVQAATHASAGEMGALRAAALDAGKRTAFSATEAAGAIENLAKAGVSTKEILGGALNGALDLAAAGELEVADAAEIAATAMTQFKLSGKDVPHIADLLAAGAGKAQGEVSDLAMALKQGGLVAGQAGLSIEETTGTLAAFASAGLLGSDAGTSLKTMLLQLMNPSKEAAGLMSELGITAYDSSGGFVSMTDLAQQLKVRLGNLTEEQRNSALATIFGSDAIRAAAVLYNQGGEGIQSWTNKVNDAGFAMETAAIKTDNLKGDVEKLGGSLETALIEGGEGANTFARDVVQSLTAVIDQFSELPNGAQSAVLMGTIVLGATGLVTAGSIKAVTALADFRTALIGLGAAGRAATLSFGALGLALGVAAFVVGRYAQEQSEARRRVEELTATLDAQTGAVTEGSNAWAAAELRQKGLLDLAEEHGISIEDLTKAYLNDADALDRVNSKLDTAEAANQAVADALVNQGSAIETVTGKTNTFEQAWAKAGETGSASTETVNRFRQALIEGGVALDESQKRKRQDAEAGAENADAQAAMAEATNMSTAAVKEQEDALSPAAEALKMMEERTKDLKDALELLNGTMSAREAQSQYQEALDAVTERLKKYREEVKSGDAATKGMKDAFDLNSKAGRDNDAVLMAVWESAGAVAEQTMRLTGNQKSANKVLQDARGQLVDMAAKYLGSEKRAEAYVSEVLGIPKNVSTKVETPGLDPALAKAKALKDTWYQINGKTVRSYVNVYHTDFYSSIRDTNPKRGGQKSPPKQRAVGGPLRAGDVSIVGEHGPELRVEGQNSWISSAAQTSAIMAGLVAGENPWTRPGAKPWQQMPMFAGAYGGAGGKPTTANYDYTFNMRRIDLNERTFGQVSRVAQLRERVGRPR